MIRKISKTAVIIPAYNEAKYIKKVIREARGYAKDIIFVDDGSIDDTKNIAKKEKTVVLSHTQNLGKGAALKTGCDYAFGKTNADAVVLIDADGQHDPKEIPNLIRHIKEGADIALGTRLYKSDMPLLKFLGNKASSVIVNVIFGGYISDIPSGYKAFTKSTYKKIRWESTGYEVETEIAIRILKNKLKFKEVPIETVYMDLDKGFTLLDSLFILLKVPKWILMK